MLKATWLKPGRLREKGLGTPTTRVLSGSQRLVGGGTWRATTPVQELYKKGGVVEIKKDSPDADPRLGSAGLELRSTRLCSLIRRGRHRVGAGTGTPTGPGRRGPERAEVGARDAAHRSPVKKVKKRSRPGRLPPVGRLTTLATQMPRSNRES